MKRVILIVTGVISIFLSVRCFYAISGQFINTDYTSKIQQTAAETGNNIRALAEINKEGFGSILLIGGLTLIACSIPEKKKKNSNSAT